MDQKFNFDFSIPTEVDQQIEPNIVSTTATTHGLDPDNANAQLMNNNCGEGDAFGHNLNQMGSAFEGSGPTAANQNRTTTNLSGTSQSLMSPKMPTDEHTDNLSNIHQTMVPETPMAPMNPGTAGNDIHVQLQNIVSTVNLCCELDLKRIAVRTCNTEYKPRCFSAAIMRIHEPRSTALIFSSGKLVCIGAKTPEDSHLAARKYARIVQKLGFPIRFVDFKVRNIVGSCDVHFPIRVEDLAHNHNNFCSYEPELFSGLVYRMEEPRITLLIFVSGKVVFTGAQEPEDIDQALKKILPVLHKYKKKD